jgi:tellurite resistance protein
MTFGIGIACWLILGSLIASRLMLFQLPPPGLLPTIVIEVAPPAVAGAAYFDLHGTRPDLLAYGLAGYAVLMVVAQLRFVPIYLRLRFVPGFWSFTFSCCAVAALALRWIKLEHPFGGAALADIAVAAVRQLVAAIAARSVVAISRHTFLPAPHYRRSVLRSCAQRWRGSRSARP